MTLRFNIFLPLLWLLTTIPAWAGGNLYVDMLDIGQGDAILIRTDEKTVLIDGGDRNANTMAQLRALGIKRLDLLVSTHPHADHIGGLKEVVENLEVGLYMDNGMEHTTMTYRELMGAIQTKNIPQKRAVRGTVLRLGDEARFIIFHPGEGLLTGTRSDLNSNSVVLLLEHKNIRMLFTGDAEDPTEHELLMQAVGDIDLLKVAHHGSGHSTSRAFLEATQPEIALISAGAGNRYRHPSSDTLERLAEAKAIVYRTDLSGHLHVISDGDTLEVLEGPLDELIGITVAANAQPPKPTTSVSEPAPIKDLPWIAAGTNDSVAVERSLEELLIQISDRRKAERKEMKDLRAKHKANRQADLLQIRAAKQDTQRQTAEQ